MEQATTMQELVTSDMIAERLGQNKTAVRRSLQRIGERPLMQAGNSRIYHADAVERVRRELTEREAAAEAKRKSRRMLPPPSSVPNVSSLLTKQQVARMLGLSTSGVDKLRRNGGLPCYSLGRSVRFSASEVRAWLASHKENA